MQYVTLEGNLTRRWQRVMEFVHESQDANFWVDIKKPMRSLVKDLLEITLDEEMIEYTQTQRHQRTTQRLDYRNGYYFRSLDTQVGPLQDIKVPRCRAGLFEPRVFEHYQRRQEAVNQAICNTFVMGVSTRNVSDTLKPLLDFSISASGVSRVTKALDSHVHAFHHQALLDEFQFLFLDGITLKVKGAAKTTKKVVLVAYGITVLGQRQLISFRIARSESREAWEAFLNDLYHRGLIGKNLKLIATDGGKGLIAALDIVYPYIKRQHCWFHKLENVVKYLKKVDQSSVISQARGIYNAKSRRQAIKRFFAWKNHWLKKYPDAVQCLEKDIDALLAFLELPLPQEHRDFIRKRIRTTNVIERCFREVRRRTRPMSCFNNEDSINRIIFAVFNRLNTRWSDMPLHEFTQFI